MIRRTPMNLTEKDIYEIGRHIAKEKPTINHLQAKMRIGYAAASKIIQRSTDDLPILSRKNEDKLRLINQRYDKQMQQFQAKEDEIREWIEKTIQKRDPEFTYHHQENVETFTYDDYRVDFEEEEGGVKYMLYRAHKMIAQCRRMKEVETYELSS